MLGGMRDQGPPAFYLELRMTLDQIDAIRTRLIAAMADADFTKMNHGIGDASYQPDGHLETLQKQLEYWDKLYNAKASAGKTVRLDKKAV